MARFTRRKFLQASGAGLAGVLASHQAPVFAQANTVHILRWNDFEIETKLLQHRFERDRARSMQGRKNDAQ